MTDSKKIIQLINKKGLKLKFVAECLGLSPYGFSLKLNNRSEFKTSEISALCDVLDITLPEEKEKIFFVKKNDLKSTKESE